MGTKGWKWADEETYRITYGMCMLRIIQSASKLNFISLCSKKEPPIQNHFVGKLEWQLLDTELLSLLEIRENDTIFLRDPSI